MRTRAFWLMTALLSGFLAAAPGHAKIGENMLPNGGFETGDIAPYGIYDSDGDTIAEVVESCEGASISQGPAEGMYCLHVVVPAPAPGENNWDVGMTDNSYTLKKGKRYVFSCFMKCKAGTLQVRLKPERAEAPWEAYNERVVTVTSYWQKFSVMTPIMPERVTPASPTFHFNFAKGDFWIDDVRLYEVWDEGATYTWTGAAGDLQWSTPGNWESTASIYNWPNEEFGLPRVNQDCGEITIGNGDMVIHNKDLVIRSGEHGSGEACLIIDNGSGLSNLTNLFIGRQGSDGYVAVRNGSLLKANNLLLGLSGKSTGRLQIRGGFVGVFHASLGLQAGDTGELEIKDGMFSSAEHITIGEFGERTALLQGGTLATKALLMGLGASSMGTLRITDGTVDVGEVLTVGVAPGSAGVVDIRGGALHSSGNLHLTFDGDSAAMSIKGGEVNIAGHFQMNCGTGLVSEIVMDGGVVNVAYGTYLNWDAGIGSRADFTLNGGTWNSGKLCVRATPNGGNACLTINGGAMVTSGNLIVGNWGPGESRLILNGGLLQGEDLIIDNLSTDSRIVFRGGEFWVNGSSLSEAAMQALIDQGAIEVPDDYEITTIDGYTVLRLSGM